MSEIYYVSLLNYVRQCCQARWRDLKFLQLFEMKESNALFNLNNLIMIILFSKGNKLDTIERMKSKIQNILKQNVGFILSNLLYIDKNS